VSTPTQQDAAVLNADDLPCGFLRVSRTGQLLLTNSTARVMLSLPDSGAEAVPFGSRLTPGSRLYCELTVFPTLWLAGAISEVYLAIAHDQGPALSLLADARVSDCGTFSSWTLHPMAQRNQLEEELLDAKRRAEVTAEEQRRTAQQLKESLAEQERLHHELTESNWLLKKFAEVIPTCMYCHRLRNDQSTWEVASRFLARSRVFVSHGCCPDCMSRLSDDLGVPAE
jgi:hypothetical protein